MCVCVRACSWLPGSGGGRINEGRVSMLFGVPMDGIAIAGVAEGGRGREREREREEEREGGREGGREREGREGWTDGGREGGREGGRKGGRIAIDGFPFNRHSPPT